MNDKVNREKAFDEIVKICLLYTSDAADDLLCVDLGGRRIIKKYQELFDQLLRMRLILLRSQA